MLNISYYHFLLCLNYCFIVQYYIFQKIMRKLTFLGWYFWISIFYGPEFTTRYILYVLIKLYAYYTQKNKSELTYLLMNKQYMSGQCMAMEHELELIQVDFLGLQKKQTSFFGMDDDVNGKKMEQATTDDILQLWSPSMDTINFIENKLFKQNIEFFSEEPMPMDSNQDIIENHFNENIKKEVIACKKNQKSQNESKKNGRPKKVIENQEDIEIYEQKEKKLINNKTKIRNQKSRGQNGKLKGFATEITMKLLQHPAGIGKVKLTTQKFSENQETGQNKRKRVCDVLKVLTSTELFTAFQTGKSNNPIITVNPNLLKPSFLEKQIEQKKLTLEIKKLLVLKKKAIKKLQQSKKENQNLFRYMIHIDSNTTFEWNERKQMFFLNELIDDGNKIQQTPIDPENLLTKVKSQELLQKIPFVSEYMSKLLKNVDEKSEESSQAPYRSSVMIDYEAQSYNSVQGYMNNEVISNQFMMDFESPANHDESRNY